MEAIRVKTSRTRQPAIRFRADRLHPHVGRLRRPTRRIERRRRALSL